MDTSLPRCGEAREHQVFTGPDGVARNGRSRLPGVQLEPQQDGGAGWIHRRSRRSAGHQVVTEREARRRGRAAPAGNKDLHLRQERRSGGREK